MFKSPKTLLFVTFFAFATSGATASELPHTDGWLLSLDEAIDQATERQALIVVDLWADWCTWCKKLDEEVFSSDVFREWASAFVLLRVNTEDGAEGTRLQEDFGVSGLPTTLIISPDLIRVGQLQGFSPAGPYIQNLDLERAMYAMMVRAYDDVDDTTELETVRTLANDFHERRDGARAADMFSRLLASGEEVPEDMAWNHYYYADALRLGGDLEGAAAAAATARSAAVEIGDEDVIELVDLLPYHIARDREACGDAETALQHYLDTHPEGVYIDIAEEALTQIRETSACT